MASGRQAMILGKRMVINLNTRGGVRKSPGTNARAKCMRHHIKSEGSFAKASGKCMVKGKNWSAP